MGLLQLTILSRATGAHKVLYHQPPRYSRHQKYCTKKTGLCSECINDPCRTASCQTDAGFKRVSAAASGVLDRPSNQRDRWLHDHPSLLLLLHFATLASSTAPARRLHPSRTSATYTSHRLVLAQGFRSLPQSTHCFDMPACHAACLRRGAKAHNATMLVVQDVPAWCADCACADCACMLQDPLLRHAAAGKR